MTEGYIISPIVFSAVFAVIGAFFLLCCDEYYSDSKELLRRKKCYRWLGWFFLALPVTRLVFIYLFL